MSTKNEQHRSCGLISFQFLFFRLVVFFFAQFVFWQTISNSILPHLPRAPTNRQSSREPFGRIALNLTDNSQTPIGGGWLFIQNFILIRKFRFSQTTSHLGRLLFFLPSMWKNGLKETSSWSVVYGGKHKSSGTFVDRKPSDWWGVWIIGIATCLAGSRAGDDSARRMSRPSRCWPEWKGAPSCPSSAASDKRRTRWVKG